MRLVVFETARHFCFILNLVHKETRLKAACKDVEIYDKKPINTSIYNNFQPKYQRLSKTF